MCVADVRLFLESARDAVRDSRACRRQLEALSKQDTRCARAARERLQSRIDHDGDIIDRAATLIYGSDDSAGLLDANPVQAHVLWWRYVDDATWTKTASMTGRSERSCQYDCDRALLAIDAMGLLDAMRADIRL